MPKRVERGTQSGDKGFKCRKGTKGESWNVSLHPQRTGQCKGRKDNGRESGGPEHQKSQTRGDPNFQPLEGGEGERNCFVLPSQEHSKDKWMD